jgi:hypothetical protein
MSRVALSEPLARVGERLARTGPGPDVAVVGNASEPCGEPPAADASEEVPLSMPSDICGGQFGDAAAVDLAPGDEVSSLERVEPVRGVRIVLVVEGRHVSSCVS